MPAINPGEKYKEEKNIPIVSSLAPLADTNAILQKVVQQLKSNVRSTIILRCEELPYIRAAGEQVENMFARLLQMIVDKNVANSKLYLHINCSSETSEELDLSLPFGFRRYRIQFYTNLIPNAEWWQVHQATITEIESSLKSFGGNLSVNLLKNPGCLFALSLPGKQ